MDTDEFVECWVVNARKRNVTTVHEEITIIIVVTVGISCCICVVEGIVIRISSMLTAIAVIQGCIVILNEIICWSLLIRIYS